MNATYLDIIRQTIALRLEKKNEANWQRTSTTPFRIDVALRCVELGDVTGLAIWLQKIDDNLSTDPIAGHDQLVSSLKTLLTKWIEIESEHGDGALLDYKHCLKSSPSHVVGLVRIENAALFQDSKIRVSGNPYWALQFG